MLMGSLHTCANIKIRYAADILSRCSFAPLKRAPPRIRLRLTTTRNPRSVGVFQTAPSVTRLHLLCAEQYKLIK